MAFKVKPKKIGAGNIMRALLHLGLIPIALWAVNIMINAVISSIGQTNIDNSTGRFYVVYQLLGITSGTTGIITVVAVILVASVCFHFVDVSW